MSSLDVKEVCGSKMIRIRGYQYLSHDCADAKELDWAVGNLQKQLERLRKQGHKMFEHSRQRKIRQRAPLGTIAKP